MMSRMRTRRLQLGRAFAAFQVVSLLGMPSSYTLFQCRMDHVVRAACCCPSEAETNSRDAAKVTVSDGCCCDVESHEVARKPSGFSRAQESTGAPVIVALLSPESLLGKSGPIELGSPSARPLGTGPPIILLTRSLLI